jgi:hypothetical protein
MGSVNATKPLNFSLILSGFNDSKGSRAFLTYSYSMQSHPNIGLSFLSAYTVQYTYSQISLISF